MCFIRTYIYTRSGMLIHNLSALPTTIAKPFLSFWQEIRFLPDISAWLGSGTGVVPGTDRPVLVQGSPRLQLDCVPPDRLRHSAMRGDTKA
jgi:hypothetical protein